MSQESNQQLIDEALDLIDYWEGTATAAILRADLKADDLDILRVHVKQARDAMFEAEYRPDEVGDTQ